MTAAENPGGVLIPVPTAVPPSGSSASRGREARSGVSAELLAEGHGCGVHQMGPPGLDDVGELLGLAGQGGGEVLQGRDQVLGDGGGGGDVEGGREDVVGRLRGVDVVVGVHVPAQPLARQGRDDLVGVHVGRGPGAGLEHVDGEVLVPLSPGDLGRGLLDGLGDLLVDHTELRVHLGGGTLDVGEGLDVGAFETLTRDGEVLDGALGLRAPLGGGGDADLAHGVVLDAVVAHGSYSDRARGVVPGRYAE